MGLFVYAILFHARSDLGFLFPGKNILLPNRDAFKAFISPKTYDIRICYFEIAMHLRHSSARKRMTCVTLSHLIKHTVTEVITRNEVECSWCAVCDFVKVGRGEGSLPAQGRAKSKVEFVVHNLWGKFNMVYYVTRLVWRESDVLTFVAECT